MNKGDYRFKVAFFGEPRVGGGWTFGERVFKSAPSENFQAKMSETAMDESTTGEINRFVRDNTGGKERCGKLKNQKN